MSQDVFIRLIEDVQKHFTESKENYTLLSKRRSQLMNEWRNSIIAQVNEVNPELRTIGISFGSVDLLRMGQEYVGLSVSVVANYHNYDEAPKYKPLELKVKSVDEVEFRPASPSGLNTLPLSDVVPTEAIRNVLAAHIRGLLIK